MDRKRLCARIAFLAAGCLLVIFVLMASAASTRRVDCDVTNERCFAEAVRALDPPFLWLVPAGAGIAIGAGAVLLYAANREPPRRAAGFTWEDWQEVSATD